MYKFVWSNRENIFNKKSRTATLIICFVYSRYCLLKTSDFRLLRFCLLNILFIQDFGFPFTQMPFTQKFRLLRCRLLSLLRNSVYSDFRNTFTQMLKSVLKQLHSALEPKDIPKKFSLRRARLLRSVYSDPVYLLFWDLGHRVARACKTQTNVLTP